MPFSRAPADIARSAAESEAPWAWRGLIRAVINIGDVTEITGSASGLRFDLINASNVITSKGRAWSFGNTNSHVNAGTGVLTGSQNRTAAALFKPQNNMSQGHIFGIDGGDQGSVAGDRWSFRQDFGSLRIEISGAGQTTGLGLVQGKFDFVAVSLNGTTFGDHVVYKSGETESTTGTFTVDTREIYRLQLGGGRFNQSGYSSGGDAPVFYVWDRALPVGELDALSADPFAPFRRKRILIPVSSEGGADITGSGSPQAGDATATGTGERVITGSTTVQAQNATVTGTGERVITDQSSTVQAQPATASGSGTVGDAITGSGSAQAQDATATATGEREIAASGSPQAQNATATGVGERIITGTAAVQADPANASGTDTEEAFKAKLQPGVNYARFYSYIKG